MEVNNNSKKKRNYSSSYFNGDEYRLLFLLMLYSVQGFAFGFLDITMPVSLKKYFSYSEVGIICWSCLPFSIKFLFAPFVDTYYFKWLGKKRSWIVPTQILIAGINFYISKNLDKFIEDRRYFVIALMFFLIILLLVLQDIAIDGWCLTIVKKENLDNASLTQTIGVQCGMFIGTTLFYSLNSLEFCNNYIYSTKQDDPILNESKFFMFWGYFILILSFITLVFSNEKNDRIHIEEHGLTTSEVINTVKISLRSRQIMIFILFCFSLKLFSCVNCFIGKIYVLNEIKYSQSKYSFISLLCFPATLLSSYIIIKVRGLQILQKLVIVCIFRSVCDIIMINVVFYSYSPGLIYDVLILIFSTLDTALNNSWHVVLIGYSNMISNPIIASTQITLIHSIGNFGYEFPKLYTYLIVDFFGVFTPNFIGCLLTLVICLFLYTKAKDEDLYKVMSFQNKQKTS